MREEEEQSTKQIQVVPRDSGQPWVNMPVDEDSLDETVRYSLDEIRFA